ncbi:unnamed protein product (macronuclear) [Paramecium tetraurelia]|uniref:THH1/TOM1/TOM3 domain-containing protein n=1 Tax=Paramecium tetraurelia TaxID=5888 RepID=A0EDZ8_PARTE|nr:uncharacterized protein GSPATT00025859001 [Paramecium tetraurelia]CAK93515.1 unnamed protein product [Paramecium tetraurelia]|eukprot:XP_001460912.1 hypothetical protein (macronuclear) [Paramecium tetraurelia strain d4-2]
MSREDYMISELIDVTNLYECLLLSAFTIIGLWLIWVIWSDYQSTRRIYIKREQEKRDMLAIKRLLLINICAQTFSYFIECVGYAFIKDCQNNNYYIISIIYFICNVTYVTSLQICCWKSTLIWGELILLKLSIQSSIFDFVKKYSIIEILIVIMNLCIGLFYFLQVKSIVNLIVSIISTLMLVLFLMVSFFFQKYIILIQNEIPNLTKRRIFISIILLSSALGLRICWNLFLMIQQDNLIIVLKYGSKGSFSCSTEGSLSWFFYELLYFPIANLIPVFLFNRIYSQHRITPQSQINRLIDEE